MAPAPSAPETKTAAQEVVLEVSSVSKRFSGLVALDNVSLRLKQGQVLGLIGPNGAGKTTLFNIIAGTMKPTSGVIRFEGHDITGLPPNRICRRGIARTFQIPRPFLDMTVIENVEAARAFGRGSKKWNTGTGAWSPMDICTMVGLEGKVHVEASKLNVSDKKRLEVARALATSPRVLLLDEFAAGLTPQEGEWATSLMDSLSSHFGLSIIWIEHVMRLLMKSVHTVVVLDHGVKIAEGEPEQVVKEEKVQRAYLGGKT